MRDRDDFPNRLDFELTDRGERERWERDERDRDEMDREHRTRGRRGLHYFGSTGDYTGVGSGEGYAGFGGPGWTSGGFGDPGYNTSGFTREDYGSRYGARSFAGGWSQRRGEMRLDRGTEPHVSYGERDRESYDRNWSGASPRGDYAGTQFVDDTGRSVRGPHYGKGPKSYRRPDDRIHDEICDRLAEHHDIDASNIEVKVRDAEVTLEGDVPNKSMKRLAEDVADSVWGVKDVHNHLKRQDRENLFNLAPPFREK